MTIKEQIEQYLLENFGPFVTTEHLAELLHRQPGGVAWSLKQTDEFAAAINATKTKLGKRVYFMAGPLAAVLSEGIADD